MRRREAPAIIPRMGDNHTATGTNAPADTTAALAFI